MTSNPGPDRLRILHLSDTHLLAAGLHHGRVDTLAATRRVLEACAALPSPDLVVVSGDVSDDGTVASYEAARAVVGGWARDRGAAMILTVGNHDDRTAFRAALGDGHLGSEPDAGQDAMSATSVPAVLDVPVVPAVPAVDPVQPVDAVSWLGGWRLVTLDTSVPGAGHGELEEDQLAWLRGVLAAPAPRGTVLVLHHPPLAPATRLHVLLRLRGTESLAATLAGSDVRVILSGHYHHAVSGVFAGRPAVVAPGVANRTETLVPWGTEHVVRGSGAASVELGPGDAVTTTVHVVPHPQDGEEVFALDAEAVERFAVASPG